LPRVGARLGGRRPEEEIEDLTFRRPFVAWERRNSGDGPPTQAGVLLAAA